MLTYESNFGELTQFAQKMNEKRQKFQNADSKLKTNYEQ